MSDTAVNTTQFYTGPKGDNYVVSKIMLNSKELIEDLKLQENSPIGVGGLVMVSYGDVPGTDKYKKGLAADVIYGNLNSSIFEKRLLTNEEIQKLGETLAIRTEATGTDLYWCYVFVSSSLGEPGYKLNFINTFDSDIEKSSLEGGYDENNDAVAQITDDDYYTALQNDYELEEDIEANSIIVGNFILYKDNIRADAAKVNLSVFYIRTQNPWPTEEVKGQNGIDEKNKDFSSLELEELKSLFVISIISGTYNPPKNIESIEGFAYDTEKKNLYLGADAEKLGELNANNGQILIGEGVEILKNAPNGAVALGYCKNRTFNNEIPYFIIGGEENANHNLFEILKSKDEYLINLNGKTIHSENLNMETLANQIAAIRSLPLISTFLDENYRPIAYNTITDENSLFTKNGQWRTIDLSKYGDNSTNPLFVQKEQFCLKILIPSIEWYKKCKVGIKSNASEKYYYIDTEINKEDETYVDITPWNINKVETEEEKTNLILYDDFTYTIKLQYYTDLVGKEDSEYKITCSQTYTFTSIPMKHGELLEAELVNPDNAEEKYKIYNICGIQSSFSEDFNITNYTAPKYAGWKANTKYQVGNQVQYDQKCYVCKKDMEDWNNDNKAPGTTIGKEYWNELWPISDIPYESLNIWSYLHYALQNETIKKTMEQEKLWKIGESHIEYYENFQYPAVSYIMGINHDNLVKDDITDIFDAENNNIRLEENQITKSTATFTFSYNLAGKSDSNNPPQIFQFGASNNYYNLELEGYYNVDYNLKMRDYIGNAISNNSLPCDKKYCKIVAKPTKGEREENSEIITNPIYSAHQSFLLSEVELMGNSNFSIPGEGTQYEIFNKISIEDFLLSNRRYGCHWDNSAFLLRSPYKYAGGWIAYSLKTGNSFKFNGNYNNWAEYEETYGLYYHRDKYLSRTNIGFMPIYLFCI